MKITKTDLRKIIKEEVKRLMVETNISDIEDADKGDKYKVTDDIIYLSAVKYPKEGRGWEKQSSFYKRKLDPKTVSKAEKTKLKKGEILSVVSDKKTGNKVATLKGNQGKFNMVEPEVKGGKTLENFLKPA